MSTKKGDEIERFAKWFHRQGPVCREQIKSIVLAERTPRSLTAAADEVIDHLNRLAGRQFPKNDTNRRLVTACLRQPGVTVTKCKAITAMKWREARRGDFNPEHVRPLTLFSPRLFAQYLGMLPLQDEEADHDQLDLVP